MAESIMKRAVELSMNNHDKGFPFAAVVVDENGKIVGEGSNEANMNVDPTAHGEIVAIRRACKNLNSRKLTGCTLYTSSEPCSLCLSAVYWADMKQIYFANSIEDAAEYGYWDDKLFVEMGLPRDKRRIPSKQIKVDNATKAFEEWVKVGGKPF